MMFFACNKSLKFLHPSVGVSGCQVGWSRRSPGWPCATHGRCGEFGLGVWGPGSRRDHPMVGGERWREGVVSLVSLVVMYRYIVYCSYPKVFFDTVHILKLIVSLVRFWWEFFGFSCVWFWRKLWTVVTDFFPGGRWLRWQLRRPRDLRDFQNWWNPFWTCW